MSPLDARLIGTLGLVAFHWAAFGAAPAFAGSCDLGKLRASEQAIHNDLGPSIVVMDDLPIVTTPQARPALPAFDARSPQSSLERIAGAATSDARVRSGRFTAPSLERNYYAGRDWTIIRLLDSGGDQIGSVEYTISGGTLKIEMIHVNAGARGMDLSTSLFAETLAKNPSVTRIEADFALANEEAYQTGGATSTPFYRSCDRVGYGKIANGSGPTPHGYYHIVLERSY